MKYTYNYDIQGGGNSHYLHIHFDRQLSQQCFYRSHIKETLFTPPPKPVIELMNAIAHTPNVCCDDSKDATSFTSELINVDGTEITVRIVPNRNITEIVNQIAKKVQRRFAKGETRQRVKLQDLQKLADTINERNGFRTHAHA